MNEHMKIHENSSFKFCEICQKEFLRIEMHNKRLHSTQGDFLCKRCDAKFLTKYDLSEHQKKEGHEKEKVKCEICDEKFFKVGFQKHMETVHKQKMSRFCHFCKEEFDNVELQKIHVQTYHNCKCDICGNEYLTRSSLSVHRKSVHHQNTTE